jgi:hypothetical protein
MSITLRGFINRNRSEIDKVINEYLYRCKAGTVPAPLPRYNDTVRRDYILNYEPLYQWAKSEGVRI